MDTNDADRSLGPVDIYFNVAIPGGAVFYIVSLLGENTLVPTPLATNLQPFTLPDTHLIGFPFPDQIPIGEYNWSVIFVRPGGDVNQGTDWLSSMSFVHTVTPQ